MNSGMRFGLALACHLTILLSTFGIGVLLVSRFRWWAVPFLPFILAGALMLDFGVIFERLM